MTDAEFHAYLIDCQGSRADLDTPVLAFLAVVDAIRIYRRVRYHSGGARRAR